MHDEKAIRPQDMEVPREAIDLVPRTFANNNRICPVGLSEPRNGVQTLAVAMPDPSNLVLLDLLQQLTRCRVRPVRSSEQDILRGIDIHYGGGFNEKATESPAETEEKATVIHVNGDARGRGSGMLEAFLQHGISERASDIHLEPHPKTILVRFRVDGIVYDHASYDQKHHAQVISRLKILSKLDIAQNRLPQDGRFEMKYAGHEYDVRVSILPASTGEKAVLRLLLKGARAMDFDQLGIMGHNRKLIDELISRPFGMTLTTGPTGSGKTTTLYACLAKSDCVGKNVITVEDPIEYQFPRITQVQVHPKIGMTFAAGLRAILRQDPDTIMVGEIRDLETLQIAMQSALTGHMVLSTMHCNDAAAGAARMVDMGAEPFLVASSLNGIVAQRLVRRICDHCKTETKVSSIMRQQLKLPDDDTKYYSGKGCKKCRNTGYSGRIGIFEVVPVFEEIQQAIIRKASASEIRNIITEAKIPSLLDDSIEKARAGIISLDEITRSVFVTLTSLELE